ncbi:MAG: hypothetical protein NZM09_11145 [Ignavibacterium sp.]|nr:hypothetical protein [Ignavibacterium sp.]MDW8376232.1 DUF4175 family protein [Ignavibacteriales bacterium]
MKNEFYQKIIKKLDSFLNREYIHKSLSGFADAFTLSFLLLFSFIVLEFLFNYSSSVRTAFISIWIAFTFYLLLMNFLIPLAKAFNIISSRDYFETAKRTGSYFPEIRDELVNSLQLVTDKNVLNLYSLSLIEEAFKRTYQKVEKLDFDSLVDFKSLRKKILNQSYIIISLLILLIINNGLLAAANRLYNFNKDFIPPQEFYFEVSPGDIQVPKGNNVNIQIRVIGKKPSEIFLMIKENEETEFRKIKLQEDSLGNFKYNIQSVIKSFSYFAFANEIESKIYNIEVTDYPLIKTLNLKITAPSYSKILPSEQFDNGNITALKGSQVDLSITSNKKLKEAFIEFSDSIRIPMQVFGSSAKGRFRVNKDVNYVIRILDDLNNWNEQPISYSVKSLNDEYPTIELSSPINDFDLSEDNRIPINLKIQDDYGFSKLILHFRRYSLIEKSGQENFDSFEIGIDKNSKEQFVNYIWNITPLAPSVNEIFSFYLEVFDNDIISGPKSSKTKTISFRVPTLEELLSKLNNNQQDIQQELEEVFKEAQELKKELDQINRELKQDKKELKWEEKQRIEKAIDKFENLQEKMQNISEKMREVQNELQQNKLLSKETLEKYLQLQELMSEMTNDEMKKALEKLRQNLEQMNRNLTQQQLQEFQIDEERLRKSIERTLNLLKRIQVEQKIDELMKRTEELSEALEEMKNQMNKSQSDEKSRNELSQKQDRITEDLENMEKAIEDLEKKMEGLDDVPDEELKKLKEEFEKQNNQELSKDASQKMKQNQMQSAKQNQQQLSKNMNQLQQMIQQMKDAMIQENQIQTFTDMMRITENLITLSKKQEDLKNKTQKMDLNSSQFNSVSKQQNELKENLNRILQQMSELSQKTFAITPEMGKSLGDAARNMDQSLWFLQNRNSPTSVIQQQEAMGNINKAIMSLKNQMESMMQGGGGQGGMMSLMQQLQQLAGQQMSLNNLTQMLQQMQQGQLTQQQMSELQRLAQQQEIIRKSLEQLNKEAQESGLSKRIPVNLDNLSKQMQEVITQMQSQKLDDDLIQKQERILSRLLDAQKSINERDFEQERQSETGKDIVRKGPEGINFKNDPKTEKLQQELKKYLKEGYKKDYEELIRKYFELIQTQ